MSKKKLAKPLNILMIDDNKEFAETLQREANPHRVRLECYTNLEDGLEVLQAKSERYFAGVILDVICLKDRNQKIARADFITTAIQEFDRRAPSLPKVILTGDPDRVKFVKELYEGNTKVFYKSSDIEAMFTYLIQKSLNLPHVKFARKFPDVFEIFENNFLGHEVELSLVRCLEKMDNVERTVVDDNLGRLRRLQEEIYLALNRHDPDIVLTNDIEKNGPQCRRIMAHLVKKDFAERDKIIDRGADLIYSIASDYGSHVPNTEPKYSPTRYTVQMCTYAILDQLLWFKSMVDSRER